MTNKHSDVERFWLPEAEDRNRLGDLLIAIKATGSVDSEESLARQDELLNFYYPTLQKIAERHFETTKHSKLASFVSSEDFISGAFKSAVKNLFSQEASVSNFNQYFIISIRIRAEQPRKSFLRVDGLDVTDDVQFESPLSEEVLDFWESFVGRLEILEAGQSRMSAFQASKSYLSILEGRVERDFQWQQVAEEAGVSVQRLHVIEGKMRGDAELHLDQGDYPLIKSSRAGAEKAKISNISKEDHVQR